MAENRWRGDAVAINQADTFTVGGSVTSGGGDTVSITINGKTVTYTDVAGDTLQTVAANFATMLANCGIAEFEDVQWSNVSPSAVVNAQATTAGMPYSYTTAATGTLTLTGANTVANAGPSVVNQASNWTLGHSPTSTDNIVVDGGDGGAAMLYGLGSFTVASVEIRANYTQQIGLPARNSSNGGYYEYRTRFLTWNSSTVNIGKGSGPGSGQMYMGMAASSTWDIYTTSNPSVSNSPSLDLISSGNPTAINIQGGTVGLCITDETTTPTVTTVTVTGGNSVFMQGNGTTVTTLTNNGATSQSIATIGTLNMNLTGTHNQIAGAISTLLFVTSGYVSLQLTGTIPTVTCTSQGAGANAAEVDCSLNSLARTFTNSSFIGGSQLNDPNKTVTLTNPAQFDKASLAVSTIGETFTLQRT